MATLDVASLGTLSPEMYAEQQALNRKQQMAQMLMQQGLTNQPQGQMVSGIYVPSSPWANLLPVAQQVAGKYAMEKGDKEAIGLAAKLRQEKGTAMNEFRRLASDPETMPQAMEYLNTNPYLSKMAEEINKPRTRKEGEDYVIPGLDGKSITLDKGRTKLPTSVEEVVYKLGLPRDPSQWTKEQQQAVANYIPPKDLIALQQTNMRLADEGIGGVALPGSGVPMANALRGNPQGVPTGNPQGVPMGQPQGMPQGGQQGPLPVGVAPKDMRKINTEAYAKQREYFTNQYPKDVKQAQSTLDVIDKMLGDVQVNDKGDIYRPLIDKDGKKVKGRDTAPGFGSFVGAGVPWLSSVPGTDAANYKAMYEQVNSKAFMDAFQRLRGGGQITEVEGQKATESLLRAKASQSEGEFVVAMREFEKDVRDGMALAAKQAGVTVQAAPAQFNNAQPAPNMTQLSNDAGAILARRRQNQQQPR